MGTGFVAPVAEKQLEGARFCGKLVIVILGLEKKGKLGAFVGSSEVAFMVQWSELMGRLGFGEKAVDDDSILSAASEALLV